jgi:hypothetical protein
MPLFPYAHPDTTQLLNGPWGFVFLITSPSPPAMRKDHYPEIEKVAIVDWDVHHGNGTQGIFYDDPTVFSSLLISIPGIRAPVRAVKREPAVVWATL